MITEPTSAQTKGARASSASLPTVVFGAMMALVSLLSACGPSGADAADTEVLGVSVVTTSVGTTQIRSLRSGVIVQLLEAEDNGHSTVALAKDGRIVVSADLTAENEVTLSVEEAGTYEVWAVTTSGEATDDGDVHLAAPQRIDRLGAITVTE